MATAPPAAESKKAADSKPAPPKPAEKPARKPADKSAEKGAAAGPKTMAQPGKTAGAQPAGAPTGQQRLDGLAVRAKLAVSQPGDAVEREADAIADRVMRMPDPAAGKTGAAPPRAGPGTAATETPAVQRQAAPQPAVATTREAAANPHELLARLGPGEALDAETRSHFEQRLGCALHMVRIHTDAAAAQAAVQIQARAFTCGSHIAFAAGEYQPHSEAGRRLLAHELAHVLQQSGDSVTRSVMRTPSAAGGAGTGAGAGANTDGPFFPVAKSTLEVPPIKARHLGGYRALAAKSLLKRKGDYDASTRGTKQVGIWNQNVKPDLSKLPADRRPSAASGYKLAIQLAGGTGEKVLQAGSEAQLIQLLQKPTWDAAGQETEFQVDHMVEYQLGGPDAIENMELLNQAHNGSVGSSFSHGIKRTVREEIQADVGKPELADYQGLRNASGAPTVEGLMEAMTVVFQNVSGRERESGRKEKDSTFWSQQQIRNLEHVPQQFGARQLEGKTDQFALLSPTGHLLISLLPHGATENSFKVGPAQAGGMAGFTMKTVTLNAGYNDALVGSNIGRIDGVLDFGPAVALPASNTQLEISQAQGNPGKYAGRVGKSVGGSLPNEVDFKPMSPLTLKDLSFGQGVYGKGTLRPSHPALSGLQIPADIVQGKLGIQTTIDATAIRDKLKIPGVQIESCAITLAYDGHVFSVAGGTEFSIQHFGTGFLNASLDSQQHFELRGGLRADTRLFDRADMQLWYREPGGFGGSGTLAISTPGKIKGIKSASLTAAYADSVFTASGSVLPDIPGLAAASLDVRYEQDRLSISGKLALDDKVPGVEKANIDVTVAQKEGSAGWQVSAHGEVLPKLKLPGMSDARLQFSYDEGFVLIEGQLKFKQGPLSGELTAGVSNAPVNAQGERQAKGSGDHLVVFGAAAIDAVFIPDKLVGKLKLRLLPDGSVRIGGGLEVPGFEVFGRYPSDGGRFLDKKFETPPVPLPGLGFSVGSVSVGLTFSASVGVHAHANVGPGKLTGVSVQVAEFDPAAVDLQQLKIDGRGHFQVMADAGFGSNAQVNVILGAGIVEGVGSIGVDASVGIPPDKPVLDATSTFSYSAAAGLDIMNTLQLSINPALKFSLKGAVEARLNLLVDTVTVWKKDWTLAEANYKLPLALNASGNLGYNSKTGQFTPSDMSQAIKVEQPQLDAETLKGVVQGNAAPAAVKTTDEKSGKDLSGRQLQSKAPEDAVCSSSQPLASSAPNQSVMPKHDEQAAPAAPAVDEGLVQRLGRGQPLDAATRGTFEQGMRADLSRVQLHTGPEPEREAAALGARAFTVGDHIAFAEGAYQPQTPEGQRLIAHELAHIAQQQGAGGGAIVLRWPAVTRGPAQTQETPATLRARTLSDFSTLTQAQLDWATSPALQADAPALAQFRQLQTFAEEPAIAAGCADLPVGDILAKGIPGVYPALRKYAEGATTNSTAWLRSTPHVGEAQRWGQELTTLESAWPAANLSLVMKRPDPLTNASPFERLELPGSPELGNFTRYLGSCTPVLSAEDGSEVDSYLALRSEGVLPETYAASVHHVRNYHHFTKNTLDGLAINEAWPQWRQNWGFSKRPLTVALYPAVDHNGAFHRSAGLETLVADSSILTIVVEGMATLADYQAQLAPVAARYGADGRIAQAMVAGHGNATVMDLAGSAPGASAVVDSLGTTGTEGTRTTGLMTELTRLMASDPAKRRIVLDACLTNSHSVVSPLRASPADAAADVQAAITADPSLRDFVAGVAGAGAQVLGSNSSFAPADTSFLVPGTHDIGLSAPTDPDLIADKLQYVEFGTEPEGCLRAVLESWAADRRAGTHNTQDAMRRRIAAGKSAHVASADTWRESIVQPLYDLAANSYWNNGEMIRQLSDLAGAVFELYWPEHVTVARLDAAVSVLAGSPAQIDQLFTRVSAEPQYAAAPRVALAIEQVWMQYNAARSPHFMAALGRYGSCLEAAPDLDLGLVMAQLPLLLTLPPPTPPNATELRLALLAAHHAPLLPPPPKVLPAAADFLTQLLGAGPRFPAAVGVAAALGGLTSETRILADIGRPIGGGGGGGGLGATREVANIDTDRDATHRNDFHVEPLRRNGVVATVRDDLQVRKTPTTATARNIFNHLPPATAVFVVGQTGTWYAIEQAGRTGFVAQRYITLLP